MQTKVKAVSIIAIFAMIVLGMGTGHLIPVKAISNEKIFKDFDIDALGAQIHVTFSNITYNTDGSGTNVHLLQETREYHSTPLTFSKPLGKATIKPQETDLSRNLYNDRLMDTNATTSDEKFGFDVSEEGKNKDHDFTKHFDTDTTWYDDNATTAAAAFNVSASYQGWNKTLTEMEHSTANDYFANNYDNDPYGWEKLESTTIAVGYEDTALGIQNDARYFLAAENAKDFDDIIITDYNLTSVKISFNISDSFRQFIQDLVDNIEAEQDDTASGSLGIFAHPWLKGLAPFFGKSSKAQGWSFSNALSSLGKTVNHISTSMGTTARQLTQPIQKSVLGIWSGGERSVEKAAKAVQATPAVVKSGLSKASNSVIDITKQVGAGVKNMVSKTLNVVGSIASKIVKLFMNPIFLLFLLLVVVIAAILIYKRTDII